MSDIQLVFGLDLVAGGKDGVVHFRGCQRRVDAKRINERLALCPGPEVRGSLGQLLSGDRQSQGGDLDQHVSAGITEPEEVGLRIRHVAYGQNRGIVCSAPRRQSHHQRECHRERHRERYARRYARRHARRRARRRARRHFRRYSGRQSHRHGRLVWMSELAVSHVVHERGDGWVGDTLGTNAENRSTPVLRLSGRHWLR